MQSDQLAQMFDQRYLTDLQDRQQVLKKAEVGALFDKYKGAQTTTKASRQKMLEQIMLALPLWLMTLPKPSDAMDYVRCMTDIDEDLQSALRRIRRSFDLE